MKKIISINKKGSEEVYDLEVKKNNNYIVDGSVLHNCGYIGEIGIILHNAGKEDFIVSKGDRIAQAVIAPVCLLNFKVVDELESTERGTGGFGSTGKR